ncbi:MAG: FAD-binding protein [Myxococcales bacterium FL481]|nr:MAG: FAD-binding protein [Myxococcales bacterium FL481]
MTAGSLAPHRARRRVCAVWPTCFGATGCASDSTVRSCGDTQLRDPAPVCRGASELDIRHFRTRKGRTVSNSQPRSMSRRLFLDRVGKAGGSAAVVRSMTAMGLFAGSTACDGPFGLDGATDFDDLNPRSGRGEDPRARVIILGAGVAGMTAAYELRRVGYHCRILEAQNRAKGRSETVRGGDHIEEFGHSQICKFDHRPGLYFNMGPARIPYHHRGVLNYCKKFGVELETFTNDNRAAYFHNDAGLDGVATPGRVIHADTRGHIAELLAKAINIGALDETVGEDDRDQLLEMVRSFGDLDADDTYVGTSRAGYLPHTHNGFDDSDVPVPHGLSDLLRTDFWRFKLRFAHSTSQQPTLLQPVGGMDKFARALEARTKSVIRLRREVTAIRKRENGVRVIYRDYHGRERAYEADYAIVTIPASVLRNIDADFSPAHQTEIDEMVYSRAAKIAFQSRRFWEEEDHIYGGISWTDQDITQLWYPANGYHAAQGIIGGGYIWDDDPGERFAQMSPEERIELALSQGEKIHPQYRAELKHGVSRSWLNTPFIRGGWRDSPTPVALREPDDRIFFAGEHVNNLAGWQEGSVISAHEAVMKLHAHATS